MHMYTVFGFRCLDLLNNNFHFQITDLASNFIVDFFT